MSKLEHPVRIRELFTSVRRALLDFALPDSCLHCHAPLAGGEQGLCSVCRSALRLEPGLLRLTNPSGRRFEAVFATPYAGVTATLVRAIKFGDRPDVAVHLGRLISALLETRLTPAERERALLVPLPLHRARRRERGYDQTRLLAEAVAACGGYPVARGVLLRVRATRPQTLLDRPGRMANVRGVFRVVEPPPDDRPLILLDDVVTTGATVGAARAALEHSGSVVRLVAAAAGPARARDRRRERKSPLLGRF